MASSEPLPKKRSCNGYCCFKVLVVLYGLLYFVSMENSLSSPYFSLRLLLSMLLMIYCASFMLSDSELYMQPPQWILRNHLPDAINCFQTIYFAVHEMNLSQLSQMTEAEILYAWWPWMRKIHCADYACHVIEELIYNVHLSDGVIHVLMCADICMHVILYLVDNAHVHLYKLLIFILVIC